jgi:hypothetical protein
MYFVLTPGKKTRKKNSPLRLGFFYFYSPWTATFHKFHDFHSRAESPSFQAEEGLQLEGQCSQSPLHSALAHVKGRKIFILFSVISNAFALGFTLERKKRIEKMWKCENVGRSDFLVEVDKKHENRLKVQGITHSSALVAFINYSMFYFYFILSRSQSDREGR